uniref:Uncharacterized protein n=1 Tax=Ascaris lumbricoides TaxID=6252 RepID=A0A0M3IKP8_ASCLU
MKEISKERECCSFAKICLMPSVLFYLISSAILFLINFEITVVIGCIFNYYCYYKVFKTRLNNMERGIAVEYFNLN